MVEIELGKTPPIDMILRNKPPRTNDTDDHEGGNNNKEELSDDDMEIDDLIKSVMVRVPFV